MTNTDKGAVVLRREVKFTPAYDKRSADPKKNYGIHCVDLWMYLHGPKGTVQFMVFTGWDLPHVQREHGPREPNPADLGYHSHEPMYEGQEPMHSDCHVLGGKCYYDGSGLSAEPVFEVLLREGSDGVWCELERYYDEVFGHD